ncbi:hypothetical protein MAR_027270 [Mya arenaria]|uniref:Uncharacterized protein n=1 Tax=Mya arenaria TaxID=6604 RepID=A0ABY7EUX3_MYAAR|nr:hypothetical protein MAR_027270 [Mya arenaria]
MTEMVSYLKDIVTTRQRDISRIVTPHIQTKMLDEYGQCAAESGSGMFTELVQYVKGVVASLITDLRRAFEPLWEDPSNSYVVRQAFAKDTSSTDASLMTFGQQTLNDLHQGRLEVSPMDVVVKSSPAAKSLLHYKTVSHAAATFSGPPANKSIGKENHSAYNQAKVILVPSGKAPSSHIASLQTSREQVPSLFSTGRSQSTNMYCTEPAPSGGKGKGPGKGKGTMSSLLLSKMTTPIQTTPTVTVKTEPPDTGYSARLKRANKYLYIDLTEDD